ncbi:hypothetical protein BH24ACT16_BH24ACT16_12020 [soil metagenome]
MLADDLDRAANARRNDGPLLTIKLASDGIGSFGGHGAIVFYCESAGSGDDCVVFRGIPWSMRQKVDGAVAGIQPRHVLKLVGGISIVSTFMDDDGIFHRWTVELPFHAYGHVTVVEDVVWDEAFALFGGDHFSDHDDFGGRHQSRQGLKDVSERSTNLGHRIRALHSCGTLRSSRAFGRSRALRSGTYAAAS